MSDTTSGGGGSSFFDALTDPRVDALIGMTQGFAQAAMPSRLPTPWGATLGMGVGGLLQGVRAGQGIAMGQQQLQQAKIGNQRADMLLNWYKNQYGGGSGAGPGTVTQSDGGGSAPFGAPGAAPVGAGGGMMGGGGQGGYLTSPQKFAALADLAMATGNDRSAATLYGMPNSMAGGAGYSMGANGVAFPTPGGAADPRTVAQKAIAEARGAKMGEAPYQPPVTVDVPEIGPDGKPTGNTVTRQVPVPQWAAQNGGPGAGGGMPPSGGSTIPAALYAQRIKASENGGGNPAAQNPNSTATGDGQFIDGTWVPLFKKTFPDQAQGMSDQQILSLRANPDVSQAMTVANAQSNAPLLQQAGVMPNAATLALAHRFGPDGAATILRSPPNAPLARVLPAAVIQANPDLANQTVGGIVGNTAMRFGMAPVDFGGGGGAFGGKVTLGPGQAAALEVQTAAQKAMADAAASRTKLITTRAGVYDPVSGKEVYRQPEYHETLDPRTGDEYPSYIQPGDNGQLLVSGGPPGLAPGQIPPTKLGPGMHDTIEHLADQYAKEDKQKYEGATNSLFQLSQQDKNIAALNTGGGWSSTGMGAGARMEWAKGVNSVAQSLGINPIMDPQKVASWEDATKIQTQLAFAQAKQLGSREAQQVISMSRAATPGAENTPQGYQAISAGYHEMNNREVDLYNYKTNWLQSHGGNLIGAETTFNNQASPQMYGQRALSTVHPVPIKSQDQSGAMQEMSKYLPGTVVTLPNGKTTMVPPRDGAPPIPPYLSSYIQGAPNAGG